MSDKSGVIYILTNPSFPEYVKIGYADDNGKQRVREFYAMSPEDAYSILEAIAEMLDHLSSANISLDS